MTTSIFLEMEGFDNILDPDSLIIYDPDNLSILVPGGYMDLTPDTRTAIPITYTSGNRGRTIEDRVADEGVLTFGLDNSQGNSAGLLGYYSPDSGNRRVGFNQDANLRIRIVSEGITYYQWQGVISIITPDAGIYGRRLTMITALDYIHYLAETDFINVPIQANKRDDQLIATLVAEAPVAPQGTDYDIGDDTYTFAFHDEISGTSRLLTVIQKAMMSGLGKFYVRGGTVSAGVLTYISRSNALRAAAPVATLDNTMSGLSVTRDDTSLVRSITAITYPAQVDSSNVVLWQLNNEIELTAGASLTFTMQLRDPNGRATRVAMQSMLAPVADTDYKFSTVSGSGNNLNANITFVYGAGSDSIDVTIHNTSAGIGYLWFFQPRGKAIYLYEPTVHRELTGQNTGHNLNLEMIYQSNVFTGQDIASFVAYWYAFPVSNISSVKFVANRSANLMLAALQVEPGDMVVIREQLTGVGDSFFVNGITKTITSGNIITVDWALAPANQILSSFVLDSATSGVLDVNALGV